MKTIVLKLAILACLGGNVMAASPDDFRIVAGRLYNVQKSTNWISLGESSKGERGVVDVLEVFEDGMIVQERFSILTINGGSRRFYGSRVFVKNLPANVTSGQEIDAIRVMRIGMRDAYGERMAAFDFGLPNTPENRRSLLTTHRVETATASRRPGAAPAKKTR